MSSLGLRNWRGQIVEPLANFAAPDVDPPPSAEGASIARDGDASAKSDKKEKKEKHKKKKRTRSHREGDDSEDGAVVFVKDEFGRDVPVGKSRKEEKKRKKHRKRSRSRSRLRSVDARRRANTPPPADPIRPLLDDGRDNRHRRGHSRSRSGSRSRTHRRRHASRSRSMSPTSRRSSRRRRSSRSRSRSRPRATDRAWTHDAFENRSPSPIREAVPGYQPEPEQWVSRAGGVYLPRRP